MIPGGSLASKAV